MKKISFFISLSFLIIFIAGCLREDDMKKPYDGFSPVDISDGWDISSPAAEQIDSLALDRVYKDVYKDDNTWGMKSLLVFRNGKLVAESYLKDEADRTRADAIWSCTKQVNGIITGIAIHQGYIGSVNDPVSKYFPEYIADNPEKSGLTLEHLLTMNSGTTFENGVIPDVFRQRTISNSVEYVLGMDLAHEPGTYFWYNDGDPQVVSGIVQQATGKTLDEYGKEMLFDPLGITNLKWERYTDGVTLGAFGILTTGREMAKIAQCVLDSGKYNGQQVIPQDWLGEMLSSKVPNAHDDADFGYYWWGLPSKGYHFMWGHGGQYAFVIPEKNMLVVITSLVQVDDDVAMTLDKITAIVDRITATAN
jgi:CubicO group peptidase (beta-lactamase class C family)